MPQIDAPAEEALYYNGVYLGSIRYVRGLWEIRWEPTPRRRRLATCETRDEAIAVLMEQYARKQEATWPTR